MLKHKIVNILVMLFLLVSPLFAGGSQALATANQASGGQAVTLKGPYPNDTIGGANSGTGQMRATTQAMREAAAYRNKQQAKTTTVNLAGVDKNDGLSSPLSVDAAAAPAALLPLGQPDYFGVANWANSPLPQLDLTTGAVIP